MNTKTPSILITGFGPFPGQAVNPSQKLIESLKRDHPSVRTLVLPTAYSESRQILQQAISRKPPDILLLFGVAARRRKISLERKAFERVTSNRPDQTGKVLSVDSERSQKGTLPYHDIMQALNNAKLPARFSQSAGGYVCNYIFYHGLIMMNQTGSSHMTGFVHIPDPAKNHMSASDIRNAANIMLETCRNIHYATDLSL